MPWFWPAKKTPMPVSDDALAPDTPFCAIGDVHGCASLLEKMLETTQHMSKLIFVGDYIDRGPDSAAVLRQLFALSLSEPSRVICLMGNHEDMLLRFMDNPEDEGPRWLRHGGVETLKSFGVTGTNDLRQLRNDLAAAMGNDLLLWLKGLPAMWQSGNVAVVHAGADPLRIMSEQDPQTLIWGHAAFQAQPRVDGIWVVHGHTIVPSPHVKNRQIAIDTGAYKTGILSAAEINIGAVSIHRVK